jgi:parallel beta-helix repeat protein
MLANVSLSIALCVMAMSQELPTLTVESDDTVIDRSCRVVIPADTLIADANADGVIQIGAADIVVEFAPGSVLRGSPPGSRPDEYKGFGIRVNRHANVTIRNARISGYLGGLWATDADGLTLENIDASDSRRAHLKSTPVAEDGSDWLWPHVNDENEWLNNYGAGIYIEDSDNVTVRGCKVRHSQNGLCIDRVNDANIYDNDFSFNSGWGLAMWRSCRNVISRNACDFCVRGYSHKVYNRGQDSAGILMFEQNCDNVLAENSATHGGDCFFGFAGREALGDIWWEHERGRLRKELGPRGIKESRERLAEELGIEWLDPEKVHDDRVIDKLIVVPPKVAQRHKHRGNNNNLLIGNDFSYAPAHGIEMTFSFGNKFIGNRMAENAICGVWGGYSQDTYIAGNTFEGNGEMGYGLERGGVNIEHGKNNRVVHNKFHKNKCGVHLWWDPEGDFADKPWGKANGSDSIGNVIAANEFVGDDLAFHFRMHLDGERPKQGANEVTIGSNVVRGVGNEIDADEKSVVNRKPALKVAPLETPDHPVLGNTRPVGARKELRGRQNIIMTEWGPWDHQSPLVRQIDSTGDSITYDLHKLPAAPTVQDVKGPVAAKVVIPGGEGLAKLTVVADRPGVYPYKFTVKAGDFEKLFEGTLVNAIWDVTFFKWTKDVDPRKDLDGWRKLAHGDTAVTAKAKQLMFKYGGGGPSHQNLSEEFKAANLGGDYFGMIAKTKLPLPKGKWEFTTTSDDGVRVTVDGQPVIENWKWHPPERNAGTFEIETDKTIEIVVEHFEIDGYAVLELQIARSQ